MVKKFEDVAISVFVTRDVSADVDFFTEEIGLKLQSLYPAGNPVRAELNGYGLTVRLQAGDPTAGNAHIVIRTEQSARDEMCSPGGISVVWESLQGSVEQRFGEFRLEICSLRNTSPWIVGKAGTHTRELIPSRLGGAVIASHIRIPNGGPVSDKVHYHTTSFQLVFCIQGWITLAYEKQGESITLMPGDCICQPPHIRHKVLETSNGLEVMEISMPADYVTAIDEKMELPDAKVDLQHRFDGQQFCLHRSTDALWQPHRLPGFDSFETGIAKASENIAGVRLLRATHTLLPYAVVHTADVIFSFVLAGSVRIDEHLLVAGDAFTMPPGDSYQISDISTDTRMLELSIPGIFDTHV